MIRGDILGQSNRLAGVRSDGQKYAVGVHQVAGMGTLDEFFEAVTLVQTHRIKPFPIILVGSEYWGGLIEWIKSRLLEEEMISPPDMDIIHVMDDPEKIVKAVTRVVIL